MKLLQRQEFAKSLTVCQMIMRQHWRFVICDWLNLICHTYLCPGAEHRGWGLPLACLRKRARKIDILNGTEHHYAGLLRMYEHLSLPGLLLFNAEKRGATANKA